MFKTSQLIPLFALVSFFSCQQHEEIVFQEGNSENHSSGYHFNAGISLMNAPNAWLYFEDTHHLFYQKNLERIAGDSMPWMHVSSEDLLSWKQESMTLNRDSLAFNLPTSMVYDRGNSSGLGTRVSPPLVGFISYPTEKAAGSEFTNIRLTYSLDTGKTWKEHPEHLIVSNPNKTDIGDIYVQQFIDQDGSKTWLMTAAAASKINFYSSTNLKNWTRLSEFGEHIGAKGGAWRNPIFLPMKTPSGVDKWVLLVSIQSGGPQMGSATQYFIGDFRDGNFIPDDTMIRWLDYGPDNYAGVVSTGIKKEENQWMYMGWMNNWLYAHKVPDISWTSALTIPRALNLFDVDGTLLLQSKPALALQNLQQKTYAISGTSSTLPSPSFLLTADLAEQDNFSLSFLNEKGDSLGVAKENGLVHVDRRKSGLSQFSTEFAAIHSAPMSWNTENIQIYMDANSIEVFINDGELVMTSTLYPSSAWKKVHLKSLKNIKIYDLSN